MKELKKITIDFNKPVKKKRKRIKYKKVVYKNKIVVIRSSNSDRYKQL